MGKFEIVVGDVKSYLEAIFDGLLIILIIPYIYNIYIYSFRKTCEFCSLVADLVLLYFRELCHPPTFLQGPERHMRH